MLRADLDRSDLRREPRPRHQQAAGPRAHHGALAAWHVGKRYGRPGRWAIRDLTLAIPEGSITALVGPNGAGKSTLIRTWLGFERPDEGSVSVGTADPQRHRADAIASIAYVPQASALYGVWSIDDHFRMVKAFRPRFDLGWAGQRITALGLDRGRRVSSLSGGERAQIALAIALALHTPILLLDEPMASLDPLARRDFIRTLLDGVRESGATVVLSSHIVSDVEEACDSLIVLAHGRLRLHDTIAAVRAGHAAVPAGSMDRRSTVGTFVGRSGSRVALVRRPAAPEERPTLEEVVLGYLASDSDISPLS